MFIQRSLFRSAPILLALWPLRSLAADCEYEIWNILQANKGNATALGTIPAPPWVREPEFRGTLSILQTCILTLTACVYTALHLNVPNAKEVGWAGILALKVRWVLVALVGPEVVVFLAMEQFRMARNLRKRLRTLHSNSDHKDDDEEEERINLTYAFFVIMGGIRVRVLDLQKHGYVTNSSIDDDWVGYLQPIFNNNGTLEMSRESVQLTPSGVVSLAEAGQWDILVSAATIKDKSKADTVQKSLVLLQVSWMAISCTARLVYELPLTLVDIHTMVHVFCAFAMYALWFHKPLDIRDAEIWNLRESDPVVAIMVQKTLYDEQLAGLVLRSKLPSGEFLEPEGNEQVVVDPEPCVGAQENPLVLLNEWSERPGLLAGDQAPEKRFGLIIKSLITRATKEKRHSTPSSEGDTRIGPANSPSLFFEDLSKQLTALKKDISYKDFSLTSNAGFRNGWAQDTSASLMLTIVSPEFTQGRVVMLLLATMYGGVHLAAWNSPNFPTGVERLLWRISCLVIMGIVPYATALAALCKKPGIPERRRWVWLGASFAVLTLLPYVFSRMFVVVESFITLRKVPIGAYWVPPWLQSVPHA